MLLFTVQLAPAGVAEVQRVQLTRTSVAKNPSLQLTPEFGAKPNLTVPKKRSHDKLV
jgi:hypothetical protein